MELRRLKVEQGVEITEMVEAPILAFMGDTTAAIFKKVDDGCIGGGGQGQEAAEEGVPPPPAAQGSMVEWLKKGVPVVITECSFLYEEDRDRAVKTKHTIWADLEPVVRKWKDTTFVLMHFSLRYKDWEVRNFFLNLPDPPDNIVLWVDGHMDGEQG